MNAITLANAGTEFRAARKPFEKAGIVFHEDIRMFVPEEWKANQLTLSKGQMAMDAGTAVGGPLVTDPNSAIPAILTTAIDPDIIRVVLAPLVMGEILGERKVGDWTQDTRMFPVVEQTGEVSSYGDYANNGRAGLNFNYPNFQNYLSQVIIGYGERELERVDLMKINYVSELVAAAAGILNRYANLVYAFGINGLQNYGIINNPFLSAYLTPAVKAWGGTSWFDNGSPAATANEVYNDILAVVERIIVQTNGALDMNAKMTLVLSPASALATKFANSFGVTVAGLLKEGFPNMTIKIAPQYGQLSVSNTQGYTGVGNTFQIIPDELDGQKVAYAAFSEKLRAHKIIPEMSAWKQKYSNGVWGTILRLPVAIAGMVGV